MNTTKQTLRIGQSVIIERGAYKGHTGTIINIIYDVANDVLYDVRSCSEGFSRNLFYTQSQISPAGKSTSNNLDTVVVPMGYGLLFKKISEMITDIEQAGDFNPANLIQDLTVYEHDRLCRNAATLIFTAKNLEDQL